jgi:hypothetical protein
VIGFGVKTTINRPPEINGMAVNVTVLVRESVRLLTALFSQSSKNHVLSRFKVSRKSWECNRTPLSLLGVEMGCEDF